MKLPELKNLLKQYDALRTQRLALDKQSAELKAEETLLRDLVLKELIGRQDTLKDNTFRADEFGVKAELKMRAEANVHSWEELQKYIVETGSFDLLQKRVTITALRQRWEVGQEVPGVTQAQVFDVTISKIKD